jgi:hypothetical protein
MRAYRTRRATGHPAGPLRHVPPLTTEDPDPTTGIGRVYAACGTAVLPSPLPDDWDDAHPRACPKCVRIRLESTP